MKKFFLFTFFVAFATIIIAQESEPSVSDSLEFFGLPAFWVGIIGLLLTAVGKMIPNKYADWMYHFGVIWNFITSKTNRVSEKQKIEKSRLNKLHNAYKAGKIVLPLILLMFILPIQAQSPFSGFFEPKTEALQKLYLCRSTDTISNTPHGLFLIRLNAGMNATAISIEKNPKTSAFNAVTFGLSGGVYKDVNGEPFCKLAYNLLYMQTIKVGDVTLTYPGLALTAGVFNNRIGGGLAYANFGNGYKANLILQINYSF